MDGSGRSYSPELARIGARDVISEGARFVSGEGQVLSFLHIVQLVASELAIAHTVNWRSVVDASCLCKILGRGISRAGNRSLQWEGPLPWRPGHQTAVDRPVAAAVRLPHTFGLVEMNVRKSRRLLTALYFDFCPVHLKGYGTVFGAQEDEKLARDGAEIGGDPRAA